ncbi:hypothetical protein BC567DRAFT_215962 [Phyllosticta citribraziliensis]
MNDNAPKSRAIGVIGKSEILAAIEGAGSLSVSKLGLHGSLEADGALLPGVTAAFGLGFSLPSPRLGA